MSTVCWVLFAAAVVLAVADWWAAESGRRALDVVAKPAVIVALLGIALAIRPASEAQRWLFVGGLTASLAGDVALLQAGRRGWFAAGLAAFLGAHLCYIAGLLIGPGVAFGSAAWPGLVIGLFVVGPGSWFVGRAILRAVRSGSAAHFALPVALYMTVISALVLVAGATARPIALAGAVFFYASDSLLGWDRFVAHLRHRDLLVLSTYHAAQALLTLSLVG